MTWLRAQVDRWREHRARALRHAYAPRLEAFREIQRLSAPVAEPSKVIPFLNLRHTRGARKVA